jgi:putative oxidoreductase
MGFAKEYGPVVGRFLIALIFLISGFQKIGGFEGTTGYIASKGLPFPALLTAISILVELGGALMIILGWRTRLAALVILLWLIPVTIIFHNFVQNPGETVQFLKNVAIAGAMIYLMAFGSGPYSLKRD